MGVGLAIGAGALMAGGAVGGGLLAQSQQPSVPSLYEMLSKIASALYGGPGGGDYRKAAKLQALDPAQLTDKQQAWLDDYKVRVDKPGIADRGLDAQREFLGESDKLYLGRYGTNASTVGQYGTDLYNQMAPLATKAYDQQKAMAPDYFNLRTQLGNQLGQSLGQGLSPQQLAFFREQGAINESNYGRTGSPLSSMNQARYLTGLDMQQQQQNIGNAQGFLNSFRLPDPYPIPNINLATVGAAQGDFPDFLQIPGYKDLLGAQTGLSGAEYAQGQANAAALGQMVQSGTSSLAGGMMGGMGNGQGFGETSQSYNSWMRGLS